mmetsp:Transcript_39246/g.57731  ORF Transcript_39246/g.57731 Transcript_39246/m.57731 type:complete len:331 (-) Transcript_39246:219-1211(-)
MSTINIYPDSVHGDPLDYSFTGVDRACEEIREATKGWGTDESGVVSAFTSKTQDQRYNISLRYPEMYDKELKDLMKSEMGSGDLGLALQYLALPPHEAEAAMIKKACSGVGTKENILWSILCGRSDAEMTLIRQTFFEQYEKDLAVKLDGEISRDFKKFVFTCLQATEMEFDPEEHTPEKAEEDAESFYEAGTGKTFGTDEKCLFKLICESPPQHLQNVNAIYIQKHGWSLQRALDGEFNGDVEDAVQHAVGMKIDPYYTVAKLIKKSCAGFGTDELLLTCTIVRYQKIMKEVNEAHVTMFDRSISDRIKDECSRKYEDLLVGVVETACN